VIGVVLVGGTWAYDGLPAPKEWYVPGSPFCDYLQSQEVVCADPKTPFVWDGMVDGIPSLPWTFSAASKHLIWRAAGANLARYLRDVPLKSRNLIAHSHGGQVALYAAQSIAINRLVTVSTPVREDMRQVAISSKRAMARGWWHLYSPGWTDRMQILGDLFDGALRVERRFLIAGVQNVGIPGGVGHSRLLNDPGVFGWWETSGVLRWMKGAEIERQQGV
jgi:hypothetical protein